MTPSQKARHCDLYIVYLQVFILILLVYEGQHHLAPPQRCFLFMNQGGPLDHVLFSRSLFYSHLHPAEFNIIEAQHTMTANTVLTHKPFTAAKYCYKGLDET